MVPIIRRTATACVAVAASLACSASAFADDTPTPSTDPQGAVVTRTLEPNGAMVVERWPAQATAERPPGSFTNGAALLLSGVVTFGLSYVPAVMTASESSLPVDRQLYTPIVGPWLDLASRPNCGVGGVSCKAEVANQALLIADGFFQGLAVIQVLAGLGGVARDSATAVAKVDDKPTVRVRPASLAAGAYGLAAIGKF
jgi:hypothetical protein